MVAQAAEYFDRMKVRFRGDSPDIRVMSTPSSVKAFIDDAASDSSVTKPVGDLYVGTHAGSDGFLFCKLWDRQRDYQGEAADVTDFEVLTSASTGPTRPGGIPNSLVGYVRPPDPAPAPAPTHSVHIKGCNIGRTRLLAAAGVPNAPFLVKLKEAFGSNVHVTAPKHFHGLVPLTADGSMVEYMCQELIVRTTAVKQKGKPMRGFASRDACIAAFKAAGLTYYDGTPIPDSQWSEWVPGSIGKTQVFRELIPLGRRLSGSLEAGVERQFRVEREPVQWTIDYSAGNAPATTNDQINAVKAQIRADGRFQATHPWPIYERRGFHNIDDYLDGHLWVPSFEGSILKCLGYRFDYTIVLPIVVPPVAPKKRPTLIYNYYPTPGSPDAAVLTGFTESDDLFFGRS